MSQLPGKSDVDRALRNVVRETKAALKDLNKQAARTMERGDYARAESLVGAARELLKFQAEVEALRERWKGLSRSSMGDPIEPSDRTPLWSYYQPILRAIIAHNGEATLGQIAQYFQSSVVRTLKPADVALTPRGLPRWKLMIREARKPMERESFLEPGAGARWRISAQGRRAADEALGNPAAGTR